MATIQVGQAFDLTVPTAYRLQDFPDHERFVDFVGGIRLYVEAPGHGTDLLTGVTMTRGGSEVFRMDGFSINVGGSWADAAVEQGNLLPFFRRIMAQADRVTGSLGDDAVDGFGGADWIDGRGGHDRLFGGLGNDSLLGGAGSDVLNGGDGNDILVSGLEADVVTGGAGNDMLRIVGPAAVSVNLSLSGVQFLGAGASVRLGGVESLTGTAGADRLTGNAAANVLNGGAGNDILSGAAGADILQGGAGADRLAGGLGRDLLNGGENADRFVFASGGGHDRIADFQNGIDQIEIASGAEHFADVRITDSGAHVVIDYGANAITIENLDHRLIDAADFIFV